MFHTLEGSFFLSCASVSRILAIASSLIQCCAFQWQTRWLYLSWGFFSLCPHLQSGSPVPLGLLRFCLELVLMAASCYLLLITWTSLRCLSLDLRGVLNCLFSSNWQLLTVSRSINSPGFCVTCAYAGQVALLSALPMACALSAMAPPCNLLLFAAARNVATSFVRSASMST